MSKVVSLANLLITHSIRKMLGTQVGLGVACQCTGRLYSKSSNLACRICCPCGDEIHESGY